MLSYPGISPVDYLLIGHITQDITPEGHRIGGTAAYAGLTAHALGQQVGILTSWAENQGTDVLKDLHIANQKCEQSTTFENVDTPEGRVQKIHQLAMSLDFYHLPESWRSVPIVHIAPVAQEVSPNIVRHFSYADIYLTPQGWLRQWDHEGNIFYDDFPEAGYILQQVNAVVISEEDVQYNLETIYRMAASVPVLAVTKGHLGADIYTEGNIYTIPAPVVEVIDATGAGDIFAAVFFTQLSHFGDPVNAAKMAVHIASDSVTRPGLKGSPTDEIFYQVSKEVF